MIINQRPKNRGAYVRSTLERKFEKLWLRLYPELDLEVECQLIKDRKFRSDYTHHRSKVTIEVHGGQYGHSSHKNSPKDADKQNALVLLGYCPFNLWSSHLTETNIDQIAQFILNRLRGEIN